MRRTELIDSDNIRCRWQNDVETGACRFDCFDPVIDLSDVCARVARDARILDLVAEIHGERGHLFKDKLILKAPGSLGYALHQDYIAWKSFPTSFLTVMVAIDTADAANGATEVFPGCHRRGCLTPKDGIYHQLSEGAIDVSTGVVLDLAPGDIALFGGYTPHLGAESPGAVAAAAVSELQRGSRRRRSARRALCRVSRVAEGSLRGIRQDGDLLPVIAAGARFC